MYLMVLSCGNVVGGRVANVDSLGNEQCTGRARGSQHVLDSIENILSLTRGA